ncbi:MAG: sulfurtransferase [Burkholderiales bacterium]|nr:sulfurtransferase [Burkholderiales bacterium]
MTSTRLVDPDWLARHANDPGVCLIEIAGNGQEQLQAYTAGHIPGAHAWRWKEWLWDERRRDFPSPQLFARRMGAAGIGEDTTVVLYGEDMQFGIYAWWVLRLCGHADARVLDGARYLWRAQGRALVTDTPAARPAVVRSLKPRHDAVRVYRDEMLSRLGRDDTLILDARSPEEYRGERASPPGMPDTGAERLGRIPGAKHLYFEDLLDANKRFRPPEDLRRLFETRGAGADRDIIAYCRLSHRATVLYFALTELLGIENIRIYDGSWTEWGNLVGVPVEKP